MNSEKLPDLKPICTKINNQHGLSPDRIRQIVKYYTNSENTVVRSISGQIVGSASNDNIKNLAIESSISKVELRIREYNAEIADKSG